MRVNNPTIPFIEYEGYRYYYEQRPAKTNDICLATKDPKKYCNGYYHYSSKDPGSGLCFVIIKTNNPKLKSLN